MNLSRVKVGRHLFEPYIFKNNPASFLLLILIIAAFLVPPCSCSDINVGENGLSSISDAVLKASEGDVIYINGGKYSENIVIDKKISLIGINDPVISSPGGETSILLTEDGIHIEGLIIQRGADSAILLKSSYNQITNNQILGFPVGIWISGSREDIITENEIRENVRGLVIEDSDNLEVYLNNFIDNDVNGVLTASSIKWSSDSIDYKYNGAIFTSSLGNYWSDYRGTDVRGDGIGNPPYKSGTNSVSMRNNGNSAITTSNTLDLIYDKYPLITRSQDYVTEKSVSDENAVSPDSTLLSLNAILAIILLLMMPLAFSAFIYLRYSGDVSVKIRENGKIKFLIFCYFIAGAALLASSFICLILSDIPALFEKAPGILLIYSILIFNGFCLIFAGYSLLSGKICRRCFLITAVVSFISFIFSYAVYLGDISVIRNQVFLYVVVFSLLSAVISMPAVFIFRKNNAAASQLSHDSRTIQKRNEISNAVSVSDVGNTRTAGGLPGENHPPDFSSAVSDTTYFPQPLYQRYSDVSYVGMGGVARVFKAKRNTDGLKVAVKVPINFDENTGKMFIKEMRVWENLEHRNIVKLYSFNILPVPFVEMEYIPRSLSDFTYPLSHSEVVRFVRDISLGIAYAHKTGIIHRDIKPHNVLVTDGGTAKVTDWGLAKLLEDRHESTVGGFSLYYAAPEQLAPNRFGKPDQRTDIYQIGILMYEILVGLKPFSGGGMADITEQILYQKPMLPSENRQEDAPFDYVIMKCIEKNPENRFDSVDEIVTALDRIFVTEKTHFSENDLFS